MSNPNAKFVTVKGCARCGENHEDLMFLPLKNAANSFCFYAICPTIFQPILLSVEDDTSEDMEAVLYRLIYSRITGKVALVDCSTAAAHAIHSDDIRRLLNSPKSITQLAIMQNGARKLCPYPDEQAH